MNKIWTAFKKVSILVVLLTISSAIPASNAAPIVDTVAKLTANDAVTNQFFGSSVAIDNGMAAVGAPDLTNGAVYTFALVGGNWVQTQKLIDPAPPGGLDSFGSSLALQNDILVVGQPGRNAFPISPGQALIYRLVGGTWVLQQILVQTNAPFPFVDFGTSVAVSGNTIAVGDPRDTSIEIGGSVNVYTNDGTSWNLQAKLADPHGTGAVFGQAIALEGNTLVIGNPGFNGNGATYVYVRSGTTWTLQQTLSPTTALGAMFGASVALEGDTLVIGATGEPTNGVEGGAAFFYHRTGGNFVLQQEVTPSDTVFGFMYANAVAIQNGTVVVGAPIRTVNGQVAAGGSDIYQFNGTSWVLVQQIAAPDASSGAQFGAALDIGASGIIVGAPFDSAAAVNAGAAYIFSTSATNFPVIVSASASPNRLFPPNHKLVPVTISVTATGNSVSCIILGVSSNQPANGKEPDFVQTGDLSLLLRAERTGNIKSDRVYTITVLCADTFGNTTRTNVFVTVPHDKGK